MTVPMMVPCPTCGAPAFAPCRTTTAHVLVTPHATRLTAAGTAPRSRERLEARMAYARQICRVFLGGDEAAVLLAACRHAVITPDAPWVERIRAERARRRDMAGLMPLPAHQREVV